MQDLFEAALNGDQEKIEGYKAANQNVNWDEIKDASGNTLIALAASKGKLHIIEYLVADGANLEIANSDGRVDVQIAYEDGHPNTARGLIRLYESKGKKAPLPEAAFQALAQ